MKDCFESLKLEVMESDDDKKASHLAVLKSAVRCIQVRGKKTAMVEALVRHNNYGLQAEPKLASGIAYSPCSPSEEKCETSQNSEEWNKLTSNHVK